VLDAPVVFDDPLALAIAGIADGGQSFRDNPDEQNRLSRTLRAFMAARSRVAEDELAAAVRRGVRQYVVLGAGLDTFAYRNPFGGELRVFEVDFPATQAWKRTQLREAGIAEPPWLQFVSVDFAKESAFTVLETAGLDAKSPAWFAWLGVSMYLEPPAVWSTLASIARYGTGSGVVFDYSIDPETMTPLARRVYDEMASRVAAAGEPWLSSFAPDALSEGLRARGFTSIRDLNGDDINAALFANRPDGLRVGSLARLMTAWTG
jgi:methyltransferase (TIGR00027 family)